eukprot:TRINITY_DN13079_c0_g1_i1.p1 TRINITY_DN13079_c0_g1~~TRINITY_DN13079_c0_g1_i1.p1  ORF type:complete len:2192 (+),score=673.69 TRINITY_DN13079_c0_g1_i1:67-6642(+)
MDGGASDFDTYLRYRRPPGFKFEFPADKKFVWVKVGEGHNRNFAPAEVLETNENDKKVLLRMKDTTEEKWVDESEVEGVNPAKFDGVDDCASLGYLSQASVLHNLRLRFDANIIYTYSGLFLVSVNPYAWYPIYTPAVIQRYENKRRSEVPPHVYAIADEAYRALLKDKKSQSMLVTGESGAGKTENTKKIIQYLAAIGGRSSGGGSLEEKILQANPLLEALGNAKTLKNNNSSRFGKFIKITFDSAGLISGSSIVSYLLERSRVVTRGLDERNFHIFYQLIAALKPEQKKQYHLTDYSDYNYLSNSGSYQVDGIDDVQEFEATRVALDILSFSKEEQDTIFRVIAAILHIGNVKFSGDEQAKIVDEEPLRIAAELLKVETKTLAEAIISPRITVGKEKVRLGISPWQAERSRDALSKAIYGRLFLWVVDKINITLRVKDKDVFIGILDIAGFEIFPYNSFEQLCINFTNERLQQFFNNHMFHLEQEEYKREKIEWTFVDFGVDSQATIDLIQKKPRGILIMLDEETLFPKATDASFVDKLDKNHNKRNPKFKREPTDKSTVFSIDHYAGRVEYDATQWLEKNKDPLQEDLQLCLKSSKDPVLVYYWSNFGSSIKGGAAFATVGAQYRQQLDELLDTLGGTFPHFVRCIIPNHKKTRGYLDYPVVLDQLACNGVLEGIKISRLGFPNRLLYPEFVKRYYLLVPSLSPKTNDPKGTTQKILDYLAQKGKLDTTRVRNGLTKVFFRAGELARVEEERERVVGELVLEIQALARGFIARKIYERIRQKTQGAIVIQKNVRAFVDLKADPWWKLMLKFREPQFRMMAEREKIEREAKERVEKVVAEIEQVRKNILLLNGEVEHLDRESENFNVEIRSKRLKLEELQGDLDEVYARQKEHNVAIADHQSKLNDKEKELKRANDEVTDIQSKSKMVELSINEVQNECKRINDSINLVKSEISRVLTSIEEQKDVVKSQRFSIEQNEQLMEVHRDHLNSLIEKKTQEMKEKIDFETKNHEALQKKKDVQADINRIEKACDAYTIEIRNVKPTYEQMAKRRKEADLKTKADETEVVNLEGKLKEAELASSRLKSDNKNLTSDFNRITFDFESEKKLIKDLTEKQTKSAAEMQENQQKYNLKSEASRQLATLKAKLEEKVEKELKPQLSAALVKLEKLTKEIEYLTTECGNFTTLNETTTQNIAKLEKNIAKLGAVSAELNEKVAGLRSNSAKLNKTKQKVDSKISDLQKQITEDKAKKNKLYESIQKLNVEKDNISGILVSTKTEFEQNVKANNALQLQLQELENEKNTVATDGSNISKKQNQLLKEKQTLKATKDDMVNAKSIFVKKNEELGSTLASKKTKLEEDMEMKKRLLGRLKEKEMELEQLKQDYEKLTKESEASDKKCAQLALKSKELTSQLHDVQDRQHLALNQQTKMEAQIKDEQRALEERLARATQIENKIKQTELAIEDLKVKINEAQSQLNESDQENKMRSETILNLKEKLENETKNKIRARGLAIQLNEEIEEQKRINSDTKTQELTEEMRKKTLSDINATREQLTTNIDANSSLLIELRSLAGRSEQLKVEMKNMGAQKEVMEREKANVAYKLQMASKELNALNISNDQLENRVKVAERKLAKFAGSVDARTKSKQPKKTPKSTEEPQKSDEEDAEQKEEPVVTAPLSKTEELFSLKDEIRKLTNEIKNERRGFFHYDRQASVLEVELEHLQKSLKDSYTSNANLRKHADKLEEELDLTKGSLLADKEVMQLMKDLLTEQTNEMEKNKEKLKAVRDERDKIEDRVSLLKKELMVINSDLAREKHLAEVARGLKSKNNNKLSMAQTDEKVGNVGAADSPIPVPEKRDNNNTIRRDTLRTLKVIKKLRSQYKTSIAEKEEQDKITWSLREEVDQLRRDFDQLTIARMNAEKNRDSLQKQLTTAEEYSKDICSLYERSQRTAIEMNREIDLWRDKLSVLEEKNSQLEHQNEKSHRIIRELEKELQFAHQRLIVVAEERSAAEDEKKRLRRLVMDEQDNRLTAADTLEKLEQQLARAREDLSAKRAQATQEERELTFMGQDLNDTRANIGTAMKTDLADSEKLRLEKQVESFKKLLEEEKEKTKKTNEGLRQILDEMEVVRFDAKTLKSDTTKKKLEAKRIRKAVDELTAMMDKRGEDNEDQLVSDLSESEDEKPKARRNRNKKGQRSY